MCCSNARFECSELHLQRIKLCTGPFQEEQPIVSNFGQIGLHVQRSVEYQAMLSRTEESTMPQRRISKRGEEQIVKTFKGRLRKTRTFHPFKKLFQQLLLIIGVDKLPRGNSMLRFHDP